MREITIFLASVLVLMTNSHAYAINWNEIALTNPGAETGDLSGWIATGSMSAVTNQTQTTGEVYPHRGSWFFSGCIPLGAQGSLRQNVDVSGYANGIDNGFVLYDFGFWHQNEYWDNAFDTSIGSIFFYDKNDNIFGSKTTGELGSTTWKLASLRDYFPSGTRSVILELAAKRYVGSHVNAFFDDASLKVAVTPEPSGMILFGVGSLALGLFRKRSKRLGR